MIDALLPLTGRSEPKLPAATAIVYAWAKGVNDADVDDQQRLKVEMTR